MNKLNGSTLGLPHTSIEAFINLFHYIQAIVNNALLYSKQMCVLRLTVRTTDNIVLYIIEFDNSSITVYMYTPKTPLL